MFLKQVEVIVRLYLNDLRVNWPSINTYVHSQAEYLLQGVFSSVKRMHDSAHNTVTVSLQYGDQIVSSGATMQEQWQAEFTTQLQLILEIPGIG